ncbi:MAG: ABC transporter ATP-binding protein [Desulfobacteraceae bacterium]|nr:ABC transporter ATP-binding protein [Desulfobacteraceae bacterium]
MHTIELKKINKEYAMGDVVVRALKNVSLTIGQGEFIAVMGTSGSGKSTLMNILGCLDLAGGGDYFIEGVHVNKMSKKKLADIRNEKIGFVFQGFNLLARTTAIENVELPLFYERGRSGGNIRDKALAALKQVGLGNRLHHEPNQLSGGQQQRVAIARALVNSPSIIFADEPTGNLDSQTTVEILSLFQELNDRGITIVLVTHEQDVSLYAKRIIEMRDGEIIKDEKVLERKNAFEELALSGSGKTRLTLMSAAGGKF